MIYGGLHQMSTASCWWMMIARVTTESKRSTKSCSLWSSHWHVASGPHASDSSVGAALYFCEALLGLISSLDFWARRMQSHHTQKGLKWASRCPFFSRTNLSADLGVLDGIIFVYLLPNIYFFNKASEYSKRMPYTMPEPDKRKSNSLFKSH